MKTDLLEILACPVCKGDLELAAREMKLGHVIEGSLTCAKCERVFAIEDRIPNLLPPSPGDNPSA